MTPDDAEHGLLATTRYLPRLRLERSELLNQHRWMAPGLRGLAKGRRTLAHWDEDVVTMAVEAARQMQQALPGVTAGEMTLASTTLPFADRLNAGIVAAAVGLAPSTLLRDVSSSARAALSEPAAALQRPADGTPNPPFRFGHIDFEGGARVLMKFTDTDADELQVGLPLQMVYRIKDFDRQRGFRCYFWKATPRRGEAA